jgi:acetyl esterase/lipase
VRRPPGLLACLAVVMAFAPCAAQTRQAAPDISKMPVVYRVPGMEAVTVKSDLKYTGAGAAPLLMDVYAPPRLAKGERRPAVLFIHGSVPPGSRAKDMGVFKSWGRLAAASGMVGVTFTHRLGYPKPQLQDAASDVAAAIAYVRSNADSLNVDGDRLCLVAYSGGGPMLSAAMRERPEYVRCLVAFYAFLDLRHSEMHKPHETPDVLNSFSPITYLEGGADRMAPMFVARAGLDQIPGLNDSIDRFVAEAISKNAAVTFYNHPRGVHGFDILTDDERSREIIRAALDFMKLHLGVAGQIP